MRYLNVLHLCLPICALFLLLSGCVAAIPGAVQDERTLEGQRSDAQIASNIKADLLAASTADAMANLNVFCFNGHVYLVGDPTPDFKKAAETTAHKAKGVKQVTTHWFTPGTSDHANDAALEASIDAELIFTKDIASTQVGVDVWGGNVVLLGLMGSQSDIDRVLKTVKQVKGVKSVTSYLTVAK